MAIKEIHFPGISVARESDPAVRRALREARAAAGLRHPSIVTVHDVVTDDGRPWIVMELIEGRSLAEVLRALNLAHQRGILHRDVKPGNIMLDNERAVLTDFSIAAVAGGTALTGTDQLIGSPEYIAPERIDGHEATPAADLWALGVTLYSALAGRSPFQRTDMPATLAAILAKDPEPLPQSRLWTVIQGLLRKSPPSGSPPTRPSRCSPRPRRPGVGEIPLPGSRRDHPGPTPGPPGPRRQGPARRRRGRRRPQMARGDHIRVAMSHIRVVMSCIRVAEDTVIVQ